MQGAPTRTGANSNTSGMELFIDFLLDTMILLNISNHQFA
jgi:hypothetical protein